MVKIVSLYRGNFHRGWRFDTPFKKPHTMPRITWNKVEYFLCKIMIAKYISLLKKITINLG